jgi:hypothetical protein
MKVEQIPINKLKPAKYNPRKLTEKQKEEIDNLGDWDYAGSNERNKI